MPVRRAFIVVFTVAVVTAFTTSAPHAMSSRLTTSSAQAACPGASSLQPVAREAVTMRCLVNWARSSFGRQSVEVSSALQRAARRKASDVVRCRVFSHRPCGEAASAGARAEGYPIKAWGENLSVAEGPLATPLATIRAWLASPPHRAILLEPRYAQIGIAIVPNACVPGVGRGRLAVLQLGATP